MIYDDIEGISFDWVHKELAQRHQGDLIKSTKNQSDITISNISKFTSLTSGEKMIIRMMEEIDLMAPIKENKVKIKTIGARKK